jgi:hypothetical protein
MAFASDKNAYGISDRSGFRYRLRDMKKEWTGALVGPGRVRAQASAAHPAAHTALTRKRCATRGQIKQKLQVYVGVPTVESPTP